MRSFFGWLDFDVMMFERLWPAGPRPRTRHDRSRLTVPFDGQIRADECSPVAHDAQTHALTIQCDREGCAVVADGQRDAAAGVAQIDDDVARVAVFDGVADGFLRDTEQIRSRDCVLN